METWRLFISGKGRRPGPIDNRGLKQRIEKARRELNHPNDEVKLGLTDKRDYYILSRLFFKFYYDMYDCNQIVTVKYLKEFKEIDINNIDLNDKATKKMRKGRDLITQNGELTGIKEDYNDIEIDDEM